MALSPRDRPYPFPPPTSICLTQLSSLPLILFQGGSVISMAQGAVVEIRRGCHVRVPSRRPPSLMIRINWVRV